METWIKIKDEDLKKVRKGMCQMGLVFGEKRGEGGALSNGLIHFLRTVISHLVRTRGSWTAAWAGLCLRLHIRIRITVLGVFFLFLDLVS